jgi:hypothetical protein
MWLSAQYRFFEENVDRLSGAQVAKHAFQTRPGYSSRQTQYSGNKTQSLVYKARVS